MFDSLHIKTLENTRGWSKEIVVTRVTIEPPTSRTVSHIMNNLLSSARISAA